MYIFYSKIGIFLFNLMVENKTYQDENDKNEENNNIINQENTKNKPENLFTIELLLYSIIYYETKVNILQRYKKKNL